MKNKKNLYTGYFEQMNKERDEAAIEYAKIMEEDKDKTYMDILPAEFKDFKRGILKKIILSYIDKTVEFLNKCSIYEGRVFDKKDVVRYMITKSSKFHLAYHFIPKKDSTSLWMKYARNQKHLDNKEENEKRLDALYKEFEQKEKVILKEYRELDHLLACLSQTWEQYEDRIAIKNGTHEVDMEKDGYPRTGRGNLCYAFIPVKGNFPLNKKGTFKLYNPRNKKELIFKIVGFKAEDSIYKCLNEEGKEVFLETFTNIENAYSDLFDTNKEIYAGWWNRTLISKEK